MTTYNSRVVAFVDILGFGDLVRRADTDPGLRNNIIQALNTVRSVASPGGYTDLRSHNFSDSLILSAANSADGLWHVLLSVDALAWQLLQSGVLIRGAVTIGGIHHDEHIVFGVGVNDAYRLESAIATNPRVVLGSVAVEAAQRYGSQNEVWDNYQRTRLRRDRDGVIYLNYFAELRVFAQQVETTDTRRHPLYTTGESVRRIIQQKLDSTFERPDVYAKIAWLARYWNEEVAEPRTEWEMPTFEPIILAGEAGRETGLPFRGFGQPQPENEP